jgi:hypothetical protein
MVTYISLCIIACLIIIILNEPTSSSSLFVSVGETYIFNRDIGYFFYKGDPMKSVGYLIFLLIIIFINEEIKKYEGIKQKHYT